MSLIKPLNRFSHLFSILFLSFFINFSSFSQGVEEGKAGATPAPDAAKSAASGTTATAPAAAGGDEAAIAEGASLFKQNCVQCHAVNDQVVGPALKDVHKRRPLPWIISFVHNSTKVIQGGDPYAVELYNKFNKTQMTSFPGLSDQQITSIVAYIKSESNVAPAAASSGGTQTAGGTTSAAPTKDYSTVSLILIVIVLVLVLITLIVFIVVLRKFLTDREATLAEEDKELVHQKFDIVKVVKSKGFITVVAFIFICVSVRACWYTLQTIGVEQGYQPVQPIPFSHKLHAGQYKIDCNYCHTGVTKSKQANIPSLNICMNCHSQIKKGPRFGEEAIKKVVDAYTNNKPVKWVRVHNLPDLAYFNHSQHVKVGGVECKTCHGPVDTMEVVRQVSPLTMGWCINCHRETAVNGKDNAYYDKLMKLHNSASKKEMKVADIGGLECSKCHY